MCVCVSAQRLPSFLTLCDPVDCTLSGCSLRGILQAGILEWVAFLSSRGSSRHREVSLLHCRRIFCPLSHLGWAVLKRLDTMWLQPHDILKKAKLWGWYRYQWLSGGGEMHRQSLEDFGIAKILQWYHDGGYMSLSICSDSHQECCCTLDYSPV